MIGEPTNGSFSIAVVDPDPRLRGRLAMLVGETATASAYPEVAALAEEHPAGRPLVAVFGPGLADQAGLGQIERLTRARPEIGAILVAPELSTGLLQQALRSGVKDVLSAEEPQSLHESIQRVAETLVHFPAVPPAGAPAELAGQGRVITVSSMKGGSGKTVVATNLAVVLAQRAPGPVVLVDADLQFGDVAVMMRLNASHTIVDALPAMSRLDAQFVRSLLVLHEPSGLLVLAAPLEPSLAERLSAGDVLRILGVLQSFCSYVVIDTPAQFNDVVLAVVEASDDIVVVCGLEIPSVKNTKLGLQTLRQLGVSEAKLRLLVNRSNSKVQLDLGEVERTLGLRAEAQIPSDIVVPQTINRGVPVVLDARKSDVTRSFERLADLFLSGAADVSMKKTRGRFGRS